MLKRAAIKLARHLGAFEAYEKEMYELVVERDAARRIVLTEEQKRSALMQMASGDVYKYFCAWIDETVRKGVYLEGEDRIGAKFFVTKLTEKLADGKKLIAMQLKEKSRKATEEDGD